MNSPSLISPQGAFSSCPTFLLAFSLTLAPAASTLAAEPAPPPAVNVVSTATEGQWNLMWSGATSRTFFPQTSMDLVTWQYVSVVEFGTGTKAKALTPGASFTKYFFRIQYADESWVATLQQARDADFDGDGIPNAYEVETLGSDPLDPDSAGGDSDGDGMPDGWERYYFGGLNVADPNAKSTPDGLTNREKAQLGLAPNGDNLTLPAQRITYGYDAERLNQVNYYGQRTFGYALDDNGNVVTTSSN